MKVEMRNFKSYQRMSEETLAFCATLYIDNVKVGKVGNQGQGGPCEVHFDDRALEQRFYDYCKSLPPLPSDYPGLPEPLEMDSDLFLSELAAKEDMKGWFKRQARTKVLFHKAGATYKKGVYDVVGFQKGQRLSAIAHVRQKFPNAVIYGEDGEPLTMAVAPTTVAKK